MLMGLHCRVKHLIVKSLGIPTSKLVWNCLKSSLKTIVKPSSGQLCPVVFFCGQMCDFLHRLQRRIVSRSCLPAEWDWDALRSFDFAVSELLGIPEFMQKTNFRAKVLKVARSKIDVEHERGRKGKSDAIAKTVMGESFNPFIDQGRQYIKYVAKELMRHPTFKSDLVIGLACFDYAVLFELPKTVAVDCYQHLFQSFSSRGWVARELRNVHLDDYVEFIDDVRHVYLDELGVGPDVEDMVFFLSLCPEMSRREYTWDLFKLYCLCLGHVAPNLPDVSLGSSKVGVTKVNLSSVIEPIRGYLLSGDAEGNFFTDPGSILSRMELLETFSDSALQCDYNPWESVNFHGYEKIRAELEKSYKAVRNASDVESSSSLSEPVFVSERLPEQRRPPAQRPRFDISKTHHSGVAEWLAGKLRSKRKTSNAESS